MEPTAVIVDRAVDRDEIETLVRRYPAVLFIAVNPENSAAMVYSQGQVRNADDLQNMILKHSASEPSQTVKKYCLIKNRPKNEEKR